MKKSVRSTAAPEKQKRTRTQARDKAVPYYTKSEKIRAVTAMKTVGQDHPFGASALQAAQAVLGKPVAVGTLSAWLTQYGPEIDALIPEQPLDVGALAVATRDSLLKEMQEAMVKLVARANDDAAIGATSVRDSAVSFGIFFDKVAKMLSVSPEEEQLLRRLRLACQRASIDHLAALEDYIGEIEQGISQPLTVGESA